MLNPFEVFEYSLNFFLSFRSFLVPDALFNLFAYFFQSLFLLFGCGSSLSSINLLISTSSFEITSLDSSVFFAAAASFVSYCLNSIMISSS